MDRHALADRIIVYCDTIVAFALVNGFAFLIALGEPDIRCSIARISAPIGFINLMIPVLSTFGLTWLRRMELRLRDGESEDAVVAQFFRVLVPLRFALVWAFSLFVLAGVFAATFDTACGALLE